MKLGIGLALLLIIAAGATMCIFAPATVVPTPVANATEDQTWISPGVVEISNYHPGARAEWNIKIHNGKNSVADYTVSYRKPNRTREGYSSAPIETPNWVTITDPTPSLTPKETKEVLIILAMPDDAVPDSDKWEFWISVIEQGQGMIQTEMCSRWLVSMR